MKRPRRPVKKVRKAAPHTKHRGMRVDAKMAFERKPKRKTKAQKAAQAEAALRASLRKVDPFYLDPKLIPVGWGYQWKPVPHQTKPGWSPVPFSRHAHDFPRRYQIDGWIIHEGLILMEALADQVASELNIPRKQALEDKQALTDALGIPVSGISGGTPIADESWIEMQVLPDLPPENGPPVEVLITLKVKVPARWMHTAAWMGMQNWEYIRRRLLAEKWVLGRTDPFSEVYEPVTLHFEPIMKAQV